MARIGEVAQILRGPALGGLPPAEEPVLQGRDLPVVRLHEPRELVARFIVQFLNSDTGQQRLAAFVGGSFGNTLTKSALNKWRFRSQMNRS